MLLWLISAIHHHNQDPSHREADGLLSQQARRANMSLSQALAMMCSCPAKAATKTATNATRAQAEDRQCFGGRDRLSPRRGAAAEEAHRSLECLSILLPGPAVWPYEYRVYATARHSTRGEREGGFLQPTPCRLRRAPDRDDGGRDSSL